MQITHQTAAQKLFAYLHHEIFLAQLVDWAESAMAAHLPQIEAP